MFIENVRNLAAESKYHYQILDVAQALDKYLGSDPAEWLDYFLGFYQAVPECQEEIRRVITAAFYAQ